jgi:hypothetical protein
MEQITAEVIEAFIVGSISVVAGGLIFETGKRYAKTGGSNQFKGKIEALPFFFGTVMLGYILQFVRPPAATVIESLPPITRVGIIGFGTMALFNYSIPNFNYFDWKSLIVYLIFGLAIVYSYTGLQF